MFFFVATIAALLAADPSPDESISVIVVGTLRTGIVAIGGETTGTTITAQGVTWELDFGKNADLRKAADNFDGKVVTVQGTLERRAGVEIKERWIIIVKALERAKEGKIGSIAHPPFHATTGRSGTRICFLSEGDTTIINISSEFGIDKATIKRETKEWPKSIRVRLHLGGLESFKASGKGVAVTWSVASTGEHEVSTTFVSGKRAAVITKESPYYSEARIVGGEKNFPLKDGYFEVSLPVTLLEGNPEEITLEWVDFYRR